MPSQASGPKSIPEPIGRSERFLHAARLRHAARDLIVTADRLDPEHATLLVKEESEMGIVAQDWAKVKEVLARQEAALAESQKKVEAHGKLLEAATQRSEALEKQVTALTDQVNTLLDEARHGSLDADDVTALKEMESLLALPATPAPGVPEIAVTNVTLK